MSFRFGDRSLNEMVGVHPKLILVAGVALTRTTVDFGFHDGLRTIEEQRANVKAGVSRTMKSMHLPQADGMSHAMDLVPYVNGQMRWEWDPIYQMAKAVHAAATDLDIDLTWGAVWDRSFLSLDPNKLKAAVKAYAKRHPGKDLLDGPHWQLR